MGNLWIQESWVNATKGHRLGDSDVYETYTDSVGRLFKDMQREYGRCTSAVYVDVPGQRPKRVGWCFLKRKQYEDARNNRPDSYFLLETWVTLHEAPPTVTKEEHLHEI